MAEPEDAVYTLLSTVSGLTAGTNLFTGPERPALNGVPQGLRVFCLGTGGPVHDPFLGNARDWRVETVQVLVVSNEDDYGAGLTTARDCLAALHRAEPSGYVWCVVREPQPNYLGQGDDRSHSWSLNVQMARSV